jgi:hypothetical protein
MDLYYGKLPWINLGVNKFGIKKSIELKKKFVNENKNKNLLEEIYFIFNEANKLEFYDSPKYEDYITLLQKKVNKKFLLDSINYEFDWVQKFKKIVKARNNSVDIILRDKYIKKLFSGYPDQFIKNYIMKYIEP